MEAENSREGQVHPSFAGVMRHREVIRQKLSGIRHKVGIYSAKGGVGKTTVAVNLAYALKAEGFRVGLLDADVDCPNLSLFLGISDKMDASRLPLRPIEKDGIKVASTAMLVDETKNPIIWRGPLIVKMLYDFFCSTEWGELDYLVIDLPPGTSDAPLTIMQVSGLDGFVIVTTPQKIASINSIRSGIMAKRLGMHIFGVVENMSVGETSQNAKDVAGELGTEVIGSLPFDRKLPELSDSGIAPCKELSDVAGIFRSIAGKLPR